MEGNQSLHSQMRPDAPKVITYCVMAMVSVDKHKVERRVLGGVGLDELLRSHLEEEYLPEITDGSYVYSITQRAVNLTDCLVLMRAKLKIRACAYTLYQQRNQAFVECLVSFHASPSA